MQKSSVFFVSALLQLTIFSFSQERGDSVSIRHFSGSVSVTHNGISLVPTFSLGKPAGIILLSMGNERFSFDPDIRFSLKGKPWSMLFWFRYKLIHTGKFRVNIGTHPALNFRTMRVSLNGDSAEIIESRRFLAGELFPSYLISENVSIGIYYLYGRGFEKSVPKNNHFLTLNGNFSYIPVAGKLFMKLNPQFYYLRQDDHDGFYFTSSMTLAGKNFPLSISAIINKSIRSDITGSKDFVWNTSLVYSFGKKYVRQ